MILFLSCYSLLEFHFLDLDDHVVPMENYLIVAFKKLGLLKHFLTHKVKDLDNNLRRDLLQIYSDRECTTLCKELEDVLSAMSLCCLFISLSDGTHFDFVPFVDPSGVFYVRSDVREGKNLACACLGFLTALYCDI